jgi:hypothetical protein
LNHIDFTRIVDISACKRAFDNQNNIAAQQANLAKEILTHSGIRSSMSLLYLRISLPGRVHSARLKARSTSHTISGNLDAITVFCFS